MANTSRELERERNRNKAARLVACEGRKKTFKNVKEVTYLLIILFFPATSPLLMISNVKSLIATVKSVSFSALCEKLKTNL